MSLIPVAQQPPLAQRWLIKATEPLKCARFSMEQRRCESGRLKVCKAPEGKPASTHCLFIYIYLFLYYYLNFVQIHECWPNYSTKHQEHLTQNTYSSFFCCWNTHSSLYNILTWGLRLLCIFSKRYIPLRWATNHWDNITPLDCIDTQFNVVCWISPEPLLRAKRRNLPCSKIHTEQVTHWTHPVSFITTHDSWNREYIVSEFYFWWKILVIQGHVIL